MENNQNQMTLTPKTAKVKPSNNTCSSSSSTSSSLFSFFLLNTSSRFHWSLLYSCPVTGCCFRPDSLWTRSLSAHWWKMCSSSSNQSQMYKSWIWNMKRCFLNQWINCCSMQRTTLNRGCGQPWCWWWNRVSVWGFWSAQSAHESSDTLLTWTAGSSVHTLYYNTCIIKYKQRQSSNGGAICIHDHCAAADKINFELLHDLP